MVFGPCRFFLFELLAFHAFINLGGFRVFWFLAEIRIEVRQRFVAVRRNPKKLM